MSNINVFLNPGSVPSDSNSSAVALKVLSSSAQPSNVLPKGSVRGVRFVVERPDDVLADALWRAGGGGVRVLDASAERGAVDDANGSQPDEARPDA
jgi:hypothetical protein